VLAQSLRVDLVAGPPGCHSALLHLGLVEVALAVGQLIAG
jgi:hypothetical protein